MSMSPPLIRGHSLSALSTAVRPPGLVPPHAAGPGAVHSAALSWLTVFLGQGQFPSLIWELELLSELNTRRTESPSRLLGPWGSVISEARAERRVPAVCQALFEACAYRRCQIRAVFKNQGLLPISGA